MVKKDHYDQIDNSNNQYKQNEYHYISFFHYYK